MSVDFRVVFRQLGLLLLVLSALIMAVAVFAMIRGGGNGADLKALLATAVLGVLLGGVLFLVGRNPAELFGQREALTLVAASWLVGAGMAAVPYRIWASLRPDAGTSAHDFDSYVDCYFEAMSGLTTTGATVVQSLATLPPSLLLWRALTHWLGGLGIVVLFVAVLPMLGVGGRRLYRMEAPGPEPQGVRPRIQDTARVLWMIYVLLTIAEALALRLCGMSWFDAVCHTFATLATGGFSTVDGSIAGFDSTTIHLVIIVFMVLAGVNFGLYHQLLQRKWRSVIKDPELRVYLAIILVASAIVTVSLLGRSPAADAGADGQSVEAGRPIRDALFQVVSIQTTTGFCTADSDAWGFAAKATLLTLMFVGASAGSTGGGIKVVRVIIAAKVILAELEHYYRPSVVRTVEVGKHAIDPDLKRNVLVYVMGIALLFALGTVALMLLESSRGVDITTAASASAATLNNIGPGFARVGATHNYAWFSDPSKIVMSILMVLGRLEIFTILVLFTPRFWREN